MYRKRFGLTGHPMPKSAQGKTFFDKTANYDRLRRAFGRLIDEPSLGALTGDPGVGKTAAIRNLCAALPKPDHLVVYLCDTAVSPLALYRTLAIELGVRPSHRRSELWSDIKKTLVHMVDERGTTPVLVVDEAHLLSDKFLLDLSGFLNFAFDSRDLLCLWLVGLPTLRRTLQMHQHDALAMRLGAQVHFEPTTDREAFISHQRLPRRRRCPQQAPVGSRLRDPFSRKPWRLPRRRQTPARGPACRPRARPGFRRRADHGIRRRRDPHRRRRQTGQGVLTLMGSPLPTRRAADLKTVPEEQRWLVRDLWVSTGILSEGISSEPDQDSCGTGRVKTRSPGNSSLGNMKRDAGSQRLAGAANFPCFEHRR